MLNRNYRGPNTKIAWIYFENKMPTNQEFYVEQSMFQIYIFGIPKLKSFSLNRIAPKQTQQTVVPRRKGKCARGKSDV